MIADRSTYLSALVSELTTAWPANRCVNIVCHGHSVPAGYFRTPVVDTLGAYPHLLLVGLKERFPNAVINVIVTAIGGEQSEAGQARFAQVLGHRPDLLLIDYALNDRGIGLERARAAWEAMIGAASAHGAKIALVTPTHEVYAGDGTAREQARRQHADQIRALAAAHGLALVDADAAYDAYLAQGGDVLDLLSQTNHPNRVGHGLVAREILRWFPLA